MATDRPWIERDGQPRLLAARCRACGTTSFPPADACIVCGAADCHVVELASDGSIESRAAVGERIVCEIRMEGGPLVMGWLDAGPQVTIGTRVKFSPVERQLRFVPYV